jgi:hypothetical protein
MQSRRPVNLERSVLDDWLRMSTSIRKAGGKLLLLLLIVFLWTRVSTAKPWRGIEPLRSTRADVILSLRQCVNQREACEFTIESEEVYILFSGGLSDEHSDCMNQLPPETVVFIESRPTKSSKVSKSLLRTGRFQKFNPAAPWKAGFDGYVDKAQGLAMKTLKGRVVQLVYFATPPDVSPCLTYYANPESFLEIYKGHVPVVSIRCPTSPVTDGDLVLFSALSDFQTKRGFSWALSAGRIIQGQHTSRITVDTTGLSGQTISVAAEVMDLDRYVSAVNECKISVGAKKQ